MKTTPGELRQLAQDIGAPTIVLPTRDPTTQVRVVLISTPTTPLLGVIVEATDGEERRGRDRAALITEGVADFGRWVSEAAVNGHLAEGDR